VRADGRGEALRLPSSPIGLGEGEYQLHRLHLEKGDRLYLFSDGVIEAHDGNKRQFGPERCVEVLRAARAAPLGDGLSRLVTAIEAHTAPLPPHDDISLAAIELT
jgi:serine phosphatase RsbU (regulator of sigma subunit)